MYVHLPVPTDLLLAKLLLLPQLLLLLLHHISDVHPISNNLLPRE
jgi:hypothetical protein